jgi:hypothetical protein
MADLTRIKQQKTADIRTTGFWRSAVRERAPVKARPRSGDLQPVGESGLIFPCRNRTTVRLN